MPDAVPELIYPTSAPFDDGVLAITGTPGVSFVSSIVVLDATGDSLAEVEIAELGDEFLVWGPASSPAFIVLHDDLDTSASDLSVLATTDGETWLLQDLDEGGALTEIPPPTYWFAINGTTVLVGSAFAWEPDPRRLAALRDHGSGRSPAATGQPGLSEVWIARWSDATVSPIRTASMPMSGLTNTQSGRSHDDVGSADVVRHWSPVAPITSISPASVNRATSGSSGLVFMSPATTTGVRAPTASSRAVIWGTDRDWTWVPTT